MSEAFWFQDPAGLFTSANWTHFVPLPNMSVGEALNAVFRFTVYFSILLLAATGKPDYLASIPLMAVVTVVLNNVFPKATSMQEAFQGGPFVTGQQGKGRDIPRVDNPFMNPSLTDIQDNPNRPPAADITRPEIAEQVNRAFAQTSTVQMDTTDAYNQVQAQRNFHAVPADDHAGLLKFIAKGGTANDKTLNETQVPAKGTVEELAAPSTEIPAGTTARFAP